ncbi:5'-3' exoribonuclease 2 [Balamuthia mandrillaris]
MGVPAFFRWLCLKYPRVLKDVLEEHEEVDGVEVFVDTSKPNPNGLEFDNLYLDMNGIIHPCAHPEGKPQPENEDEIMKAIFEYIDRLFAIVRPRKVLFMAIDGVAPRAKMNQQRSRRFKASKESQEKAKKEEEIRQELLKMGREAPPPKEHRFDSNVITPGTKFMARVAESLDFYITERLNTDPGWKGVKVILSDANVPGEGEHKIMEFIRHQRAQPSYDPNTRHVLYGLDADLIMLSLATHEPHFYILREVILQNNQNNCFICGQPGHMASECKGKAREKQGEFDEQDFKRQPFQFVYIPILREYLDVDLRPPGECLWGDSKDYDLERLIDDFVFLCFFVGNDFLPHLPTLEIREKAIDRLCTLYKQMLPSLGGYLTKHGEVDLKRVKQLMHEVGKMEDSILVERRRREQRRKEGRRRARMARKRQAEELAQHLARNEERDQKRQRLDETGRAIAKSPKKTNKDAAQALKASIMANDDDEDAEGVEQKAEETMEGPEAEEASPDDEVEGEAKEETEETEAEAEKGKQTGDKTEGLLSARDDDESEPEPPDDVRLGEAGWKERYYRQKFNVDENDVGFKTTLAEAYAEGLVWVLRYYYQGCRSWGWYYPFHYSPFAEDMQYISTESPSMEQGTPFKPFEQLMSVLPAASGHCLPPACQKAMSDPDSSIIDFYPEDFALDMNGKRYTWQAVALLPFIDEDRLLSAMKVIERSFSEEEKSRNQMGNHLLYVHSSHPAAPLFASLYEERQSSETTPEDKEKQEEEEQEKGKEGSSKEKDKSSPAEGVTLDPSLTHGFNGTIRRVENALPIGAEVVCPIPDVAGTRNNQVYKAIFDLPPVPEGHIFDSKLLSGCVPPPPVLSQDDFSSLRTTRLHREHAGRMLNHHLPSSPYSVRGGRGGWNAGGGRGRGGPYYQPHGYGGGPHYPPYQQQGYGGHDGGGAQQPGLLGNAPSYESRQYGGSSGGQYRGGSHHRDDDRDRNRRHDRRDDYYEDRRPRHHDGERRDDRHHRGGGSRDYRDERRSYDRRQPRDDRDHHYQQGGRGGRGGYRDYNNDRSSSSYPQQHQQQQPYNNYGGSSSSYGYTHQQQYQQQTAVYNQPPQNPAVVALSQLAALQQQQQGAAFTPVPPPQLQPPAVNPQQTQQLLQQLQQLVQPQQLGAQQQFQQQPPRGPQ